MALQLAKAQETWEIQNDYSIRFDGRGAEGTFGGLSGTIQFDPEKLSQSSFDVTLDPATIDTGNDTKDKHARGDSWFHVKKYPKITFRSENISKKADNGYIAKGKLTLHGTTLEAAIDFTFVSTGENEGVFEGSMSINREAYGIEGPWLSFTVGDDFQVNISVPVRKSSQ
ncbi:MAG: YceI family protein [Cyclobacteriaceae bacterium]